MHLICLASVGSQGKYLACSSPERKKLVKTHYEGLLRYCLSVFRLLFFNLFFNTLYSIQLALLIHIGLSDIELT